jgi:hypothetical protein
MTSSLDVTIFMRSKTLDISEIISASMYVFMVNMCKDIFLASHTYEDYCLLGQRCTNSSHQIVQVTKFCTRAPSIFSVCMVGVFPPFRMKCRSVHKHHAEMPENSEAEGTGSSVGNLFHVTFLVHRTLR